MSMRLLTREDFFKELARLGLTPTDEKTETHQIWRARDGQFVPVPCNQDVVPDYILDALVMKVGQLYQCAAPAVSKAYTVSEASEVVNFKGKKST